MMQTFFQTILKPKRLNSRIYKICRTHILNHFSNFFNLKIYYIYKGIILKIVVLIELINLKIPIK